MVAMNNIVGNEGVAQGVGGGKDNDSFMDFDNEATASPLFLDGKIRSLSVSKSGTGLRKLLGLGSKIALWIGGMIEKKSSQPSPFWQGSSWLPKQYLPQQRGSSAGHQESFPSSGPAWIPQLQVRPTLLQRTLTGFMLSWRRRTTESNNQQI